MPENQDKKQAASAKDPSTSEEEKANGVEGVEEGKGVKEGSSSVPQSGTTEDKKETSSSAPASAQPSPRLRPASKATTGKKAAEDKKEGKDGKKEEKKVSESDANKKRVLIAEDERPLAHALELKFTHEGYATFIAKDGEEAMNLVKEMNPDVILLDLIMPKVDGFAFLEAIRETGNKSPIIVLSNLGQEEDIEHAKNFGVKAYFVKSNTPIMDIVKEVKSVL